VEQYARTAIINRFDDAYWAAIDPGPEAGRAHLEGHGVIVA
jgi:hypothetical protein